ncbi:Uncharacterised protein [uncultured archaeon]|nr:Uncharacterised protein [uncultured archaeon]
MKVEEKHGFEEALQLDEAILGGFAEDSGLHVQRCRIGRVRGTGGGPAECDLARLAAGDEPCQPDPNKSSFVTDIPFLCRIYGYLFPASFLR